VSARIQIVDDHPVVREGYKRLIELQSGWRIVAESEDAQSAYVAFRQTTPDVVVMDISLRSVSGVEALRHIRQYDRRARVVMFTMHQSAAFALKAFEAGALGYVTKSSDPDCLLEAIRCAISGKRYLSQDIASSIADERVQGGSDPLQDLSPRETEILRLIAEGTSSQEIAEQLCLSLKTVQNNHYQIKSKLAVETDAQMVLIALKAGLVQI
jgi:two-component system invasion response regulator UvrY